MAPSRTIIENRQADLVDLLSIHDSIGSSLLRGLVACMQRNRFHHTPPEDIDGQKFGGKDRYAEHRFGEFFLQTVHQDEENTLEGWIEIEARNLAILRDVCRNVEQESPGRYQAEIQFVLEACIREEKESPKLVVKMVKDEKRASEKVLCTLNVCHRHRKSTASGVVVQKVQNENKHVGTMVFADTWRLWNEFCRCIQVLQQSDQDHIHLFRECDPIPEAMIQDFWDDYREMRHFEILELAQVAYWRR